LKPQATAKSSSDSFPTGISFSSVKSIKIELDEAVVVEDDDEEDEEEEEDDEDDDDDEALSSLLID
jgi:hypothetical protein